MATNGSQDNFRSIETGELRIDDNPIRITLNHKNCSYRAFDRVLGIDGRNYDFQDKLPLVASDKGLVLREMRAAISEGRKVTATTAEYGRSTFIKKGRLVLGFSEKQALISVGRLGLSSILGMD